MGEVIDYTAWRLEKLADSQQNPHDTELIMNVLSSYYEGDIAIAWELGQPVLMPTEPGDWHGWRDIPQGFSVTGYQGDEQEGEVEVDDV
jgi:hypothetical protein|tara:strand:+ start:4423 stop:4689 length:267 start_codon:yes stop_codon:yes gene_type:complete